MYQRDLFDTQIQIGDQLIEQKSQPFHPTSTSSHNPAAVAKFRAKENAVEYNRHKWNRLDNDGQEAYRKRVNKVRMTNNILFTDGTWVNVTAEKYAAYPVPEQPERNYYQAI